MISLDLDHFKAVNDTFGHAAGDTRPHPRVAERLTASVRDGDAVFRLGGEEFLIVLPDAEETSAVAIAERIRTTIKHLDLTGPGARRAHHRQRGPDHRPRRRPDTFPDAFHEADIALYQSKENGRDKVTVHHSR